MEQALAASDSVGFPLIIKPSFNQGSRGVFRVLDRDGLVHGFPDTKEHVRAGEIIVEEYMEGPELRLDGVQLASGLYNLPLGDALLFGISGTFIPKSTSCPSRLPALLQSKVLALNSAIVQEMGLPFGLSHSEFRVEQQTGEVIFVEVAARGGGSFISSDPLPLACGIDPEKVLLGQSLRLAVDLPEKPRERAAAYYTIAGLPSGLVREIGGIEAAKKIPGVERVVSSLRIGSVLQSAGNKTFRLACFILSGKSREDIDQTIYKLEKALSFLIRTENGDVVYYLAH